MVDQIVSRHLSSSPLARASVDKGQKYGRSLSIDKLMDNNIQWARDMTGKMPGFFKELSQQQAPEYLWIGCSDSRVPSNEIIRLRPGEVFTHRNIANVVNHTDFSCLSVVQYAVEVLKVPFVGCHGLTKGQVKHIIVCGHYRCGGVLAAQVCISHC